MPAFGPKEKRCRVLGCGKLLLVGGPCATYCRKRRICYTHLQAAAIEQAGQCYRFCHQCGRLHPLSGFVGTRRSCAASLSKRREKEAQAHGRAREAAQPTPTHGEQEAAAGRDAPCMAADKGQEQEQHWQLLPAGFPALAGSVSAGEAAAASADAGTAGLPQHCCRSSGGDTQVAATPLVAPPPTADHGGCGWDDELADLLLQELLREVQWGPAAEASACSAGGSNGCMHGAARLPPSSGEEQELEQLVMLLEQELLAAAVAPPAAAGRPGDTDTRHNNSSCCCLSGLAGPAAAAAPARHLPAPGSFFSGVGGQEAERGPTAQQIASRQRHQELLWQHQQLSALLQQVSAAVSMLQLLL